MMAKICRQCRYFYHGHKNEPSLCTNKKSKKFPNKISKNGHDHVCALFRPIKKHNHSPDLPQANKKGVSSHNHSASLLKIYKGKLKFIENLRGVYAGKEIWILATGPSLDDIPGDFLQNPEPKISIAVKEAAIPFPDCTYNIWPFRDYPFRHIYLPRGQIPGKFGKFIFTIRDKDKDNYYGRQIFKPTYLKYAQGGTVATMKSMCESIIVGNSSVYYGVGTITHLAIAAALVMGATKISLVGCDHGTIGGKIRAQRIKGGYGWQTPHIKPYEDMKVGTNFLANFFRNHGIEIVRYYYGRGYEEIGDVVKDKETIQRAENGWKDVIKKGVDWEKSKGG